MPFLVRVKILQWYLRCYGLQCNNSCFSNLISIGLRGNFESNGFTYATPFPVIVCLGVNDVLFGYNVNDTTPVFPGSTRTLFLTVSGTEIC